MTVPGVQEAGCWLLWEVAKEAGSVGCWGRWMVGCCCRTLALLGASEEARPKVVAAGSPAHLCATIDKWQAAAPSVHASAYTALALLAKHTHTAGDFVSTSLGTCWRAWSVGPVWNTCRCWVVRRFFFACSRGPRA